MIESGEGSDVAADEQARAGAVRWIQHLAREQAKLEATRLRAIERFARLNADDEWTQDLLAVETNVSMAKAGADLALAHNLVNRLPKTMEALSHGALDVARARQIEHAITPLTDEQAKAVEDRVLPGALEATPRQLYERVRAAVLAVDPEGAQLRAEVRRQQRRVSVADDLDGMSWLNALLSSADAHAIYSRVDAVARQVSDGEQGRSMDQLRADALRDLVLGTRHSRVVTHVYVTTSIATLAGVDEQPGVLRGYGAIPAERVRELAYGLNATWRAVELDERSRPCRMAEKRYRPSDHLTELIQLRDQTCRFPACTRSAQRCDIDHRTPYNRGGSTCPHNCQALCRRHHRLKHSERWNLDQGEDGELVWTAPTGTPHGSAPEPLPPPNVLPDQPPF